MKKKKMKSERKANIFDNLIIISMKIIYHKLIIDEIFLRFFHDSLNLILIN